LPGLLLLYAVYAAGLAVSISAAMGQFLRQFLWRSPVPSLLPFTPLEPLRYSITHPHPPLAGLSLSEVPLSLRHLPPPVCIGAAYSGFGGCLAGVSQAVSRGGQQRRSAEAVSMFPRSQEPGARSQGPKPGAKSQSQSQEPAINSVARHFSSYYMRFSPSCHIQHLPRLERFRFPIAFVCFSIRPAKQLQA
jgi:hypothetical protein